MLYAVKYCPNDLNILKNIILLKNVCDVVFEPSIWTKYADILTPFGEKRSLQHFVKQDKTPLLSVIHLVEYKSDYQLLKNCTLCIS